MGKSLKSFQFTDHPAKNPKIKMTSFRLIGSATNPKIIASDYWAILFLVSAGALIILVTLGSSI